MPLQMIILLFYKDFKKRLLIGIFVLNIHSMTQVTMHIDNKKKLAAIKTILEAMDIAYDAQEPVKKISDKEQMLLQQAEADVTENRLHSFKSHREILGR